MDKVHIEIQNGKKGFEPVVLDDIQWKTERKGSPGKLTVKILWDKKLKIEEGNVVSFKVGKKSIFYGYIFKQTTDESDILTLTCYDQMRYLKNKDTYKFENMTADRIARMIFTDFGLKFGTIEETPYVISAVVYDDKTLLDIIQDALDMTLTNTRNLYVMYDDYGKMVLKKIQKMKVNLLIDAATSGSYEYTSSIDSETYNLIKLEYEDSDTNERTMWGAEDKKTQQKWGTLQYFESISSDEKDTAQSKANALLELYNQRTKNLKISNIIGDWRIRGGSVVMVQLKIGTETVNNWMVVDSCTHTLKQNEHFMSLKLIGGGFVA